ncbi:MAG: DNA polymerase IV, partial [Sulfolobaceae archaeon]
MNIIAFIDIDYFFAQVEEILDPSLKGKPIVVCVYSGRSKDSGAVATANYEARKLGIKAGMPISQAKKIAPFAIFLPMRKELYKQFSENVIKVLSRFTNKIEVASIDEAYLDITEVVKDFKEAELIGRKIKESILNELGLKVTVGISFNKVLAKIAAELVKPNGLKVIDYDEAKSLVESLSIDEIPGLGDVLSKKLKEIGVNKLSDVRNIKYNELKKLIGESKAKYLIKLLELKIFEPITPKNKKSIARTLTLPKNTRNLDEIKLYLIKAIEEVYSKIDGIPRTISVFTIMEDLDIVSRSRTYKYGINKDSAVFKAIELLREILEIDKRNVRRVGVRVSKLQKYYNLNQF